MGKLLDVAPRTLSRCYARAWRRAGPGRDGAVSLFGPAVLGAARTWRPQAWAANSRARKRETERDTERERERERSVFTETREEKYKKYAKHTQNKREMGESEIAQFVVIVSWDPLSPLISDMVPPPPLFRTRPLPERCREVKVWRHPEINDPDASGSFSVRGGVLGHLFSSQLSRFYTWFILQEICLLIRLPNQVGPDTDAITFGYFCFLSFGFCEDSTIYIQSNQRFPWSGWIATPHQSFSELGWIVTS